MQGYEINNLFAEFFLKGSFINFWKINYFLIFKSILKKKSLKTFSGFNYVIENKLKINLLIFFKIFIKKIKLNITDKKVKGKWS